MVKTFSTVITIFLLLLLIACSQEEQMETSASPNSLIFNTPEVVGEAEISPWNGADFHLSLSDEQLLAAFPVLEMIDYDDNEWNRSEADYQTFLFYIL